MVHLEDEGRDYRDDVKTGEPRRLRDGVKTGEKGKVRDGVTVVTNVTVVRAVSGFLRLFQYRLTSA